MKNKLKKLRLQNKLTQEETANKLGVTRQTIISIETDKYIPSLPLALKISKLFKKRVEEIFNY